MNPNHPDLSEMWNPHLGTLSAKWQPFCLSLGGLVKFSSLFPLRFERNFDFKLILISKLIWVIDWWLGHRETAVRWMSLSLSDDKSTLVQVMVSCCQVTSHYLSQCWPRSMSPYHVTRWQWVKNNRTCPFKRWSYLELWLSGTLL